MKTNSVLKLKRIAWASAGLVLAAVLSIAVTRLGAKPKAQATPPPIVEVAPVEQKDVPVYGEWIGTLAGHVNADVKAQVTGYLLTRSYKEGSYVRKGQLLFEIDPRPFQAALDQAKGQLAQAEALLVQNQAQLATAEANELKSHLDVEKYGPLAKADAVSKRISTTQPRRTLPTRPRCKPRKQPLDLQRLKFRPAKPQSRPQASILVSRASFRPSTASPVLPWPR
jgi:multidrug efflux pump subunit AcrA (membrane-fusion protein)